MSYPSYTRAERIADAAVHVLGVGMALVAVTLLFLHGADQMPPITKLAWGVYAAAMVIMLTASAAYHMAAHTALRPLLRRIDHAASYVKIAGTFTPMAVLLNTTLAYSVLALAWTLALMGALHKLSAARGQMSTHWLPQLALGWLGTLLIIPLWPSLPGHSAPLILSGGLIYSGAVVFYCWESLKYANAIWHACVLLATACCFLGLAEAVTFGPAPQATNLCEAECPPSPFFDGA